MDLTLLGTGCPKVDSKLDGLYRSASDMYNIMLASIMKTNDINTGNITAVMDNNLIII